MIGVFFVLAAIAGGAARWGLARWANDHWPIGTLVANLVGAFSIGALHELTGGSATVVLVAGLGSLTSVSAVAKECGAMVAANRRLDALAYVSLTLSVGVGACAVGLTIS